MNHQLFSNLRCRPIPFPNMKICSVGRQQSEALNIVIAGNIFNKNVVASTAPAFPLSLCQILRLGYPPYSCKKQNGDREKKWYRCCVSVCDRCSDSIKNSISLQLLLLDEEACRSRTFQPGRVGWTLSSLNQNQAVACAQKSNEKETSRLRWPDKNGEQKNSTASCVPSCYLLRGRFSKSSVPSRRCMTARAA